MRTTLLRWAAALACCALNGAAFAQAPAGYPATPTRPAPRTSAQYQTAPAAPASPYNASVPGVFRPVRPQGSAASTPGGSRVFVDQATPLPADYRIDGRAAPAAVAAQPLTPAGGPVSVHPPAAPQVARTAWEATELPRAAAQPAPASVKPFVVMPGLPPLPAPVPPASVRIAQADKPPVAVQAVPAKSAPPAKSAAPLPAAPAKPMTGLPAYPAASAPVKPMPALPAYPAAAAPIKPTVEKPTQAAKPLTASKEAPAKTTPKETAVKAGPAKELPAHLAASIPARTAATPAAPAVGVTALGLGGFPSPSTACAGWERECGPAACCVPGCVPCGPPGRAWVGAEYIAWAGQGDSLPALVSASPVGTPREVSGVLSSPTSRVLFGDSNTNNDLRSGVRVYGGLWLDQCQKFGINADYFYLGQGSETFEGGSDGNPQLSRPFFNAAADANRPDAELVSFPGVLTGSVFADVTSDAQGANPNFLCNLCCDCNYRVDALLGYRFFDLDDRVDVVERLVSIDPASQVPAGTQLVVRDTFRTSNTFHGGNIGLTGERRFGRAYVAATAAVALGVVHKEVEVSGSTTVTVPGQAPQTSAGGLLAQRTNIGRYTRDDFAVMPAANLRAGYQVTDGLRAYVGYDFLYLSNVTRPGDVIDPSVNRTQLPPGTLQGPARPAFQFRDSDYWLQGISGGIELRF